jgi:hypothetical protein
MFFTSCNVSLFDDKRNTKGHTRLNLNFSICQSIPKKLHRGDVIVVIFHLESYMREDNN